MPLIDYRANKTGNIGFTISNYGNLGYYNENEKASIVYPKGSKSSYIFGSGFYITGKRKNEAFLIKNYDLQTARSQFVPGRIEDGKLLDSNKFNNYQIFFSSDYDKNTGTPKFGGDEPNWPVWKSNYSPLSKFLGDYEINNSKRNKSNFIEPAITSDDDIFLTYKNTDLKSYDNKILDYKSLNLPIEIQVEELINTWNAKELKDCAILNYKFINMSLDTLIDCYFVPSFDIHITNTDFPFFGNDNDNAIALTFNGGNYNFPIGVFWSDSSRYEIGHSQNYVAIGIINSPKVNSNGFVLNSNSQVTLNETSYNKLPIFINADADYLNNPSKFYNAIENLPTIKDKKQNSIKTLFPSNKFSLLPKDTVRFSVLVTFAKPSNKTLPKGDNSELVQLNSNIKFATDYFYSQFNYLGIDDIKENKDFKQIENEIYIKNIPNIILVSDISGREYKLTTSREESDFKIFDIKNLPNGIYLVKFDKQSLKFIKN
ncbi:MAG: hypothetical protein NTW25_13000 [Candidatus Kapabacteria bacterium]|nr:hypothetical protein [Candidatus Kapabacteria bacterium]